jgi:hypothetical protein
VKSRVRVTSQSLASTVVVFVALCVVCVQSRPDAGVVEALNAIGRSVHWDTLRHYALSPEGLRRLDHIGKHSNEWSLLSQQLLQVGVLRYAPRAEHEHVAAFRPR